MRIAALLLSLGAASAWGVGALLLKRGADVVSPSTILVFQYAVGIALLAGWIVVTAGVGATAEALERRWGLLLLIALFQIGGYVLFISAVRYAGEGSLPTAVAVAISAAYPTLVVLLSGPFLGEALHWNHALGVLLVVSGVIVAQVL